MSFQQPAMMKSVWNHINVVNAAPQHFERRGWQWEEQGFQGRHPAKSLQFIEVSCPV